MILKTIISFINTKLDELDLFGRNIYFCELIKKDEQELPAYFTEGEHEAVALDKDEVYSRKNGTVRIREVEDNSNTETYQERTYPIKVVASVSRRSLDNYNSYAGDYLADLIIKKLASNNIKALSKDIGAESTQIAAVSYNTNPFEIWSEEYKQVQMNADFTEKVLIVIEFEITVTGAITCFNNV